MVWFALPRDRRVITITCGSRTAGELLFFVGGQRKVTQRKPPPDGANMSALLSFGTRAASTRHPVARGSRLHPCRRPLRGAHPKPAMLAMRHTGPNVYGITSVVL